MKITAKKGFLFFTAFFIFSTAFSQVRLPKIVSDGMVLQRDTKMKIWGWAANNEKLSVKFNGKTYRTKADAHGNWFILLPSMKAGGPYTMDITCKQ